MGSLFRLNFHSDHTSVLLRIPSQSQLRSSISMNHESPISFIGRCISEVSRGRYLLILIHIQIMTIISANPSIHPSHRIASKLIDLSFNHYPFNVSNPFTHLLINHSFPNKFSPFIHRRIHPPTGSFPTRLPILLHNFRLLRLPLMFRQRGEPLGLRIYFCRLLLLALL